MKRFILIFVLHFFGVSSMAQITDESVLVTIDDKEYTISDFRRVYEKNLDAIEDEEAKSISKNLDLYINYKLKVSEAYRLKLDTLGSYKNEIEVYRNQLSAPYMQDSAYMRKLVNDAYYRLKNEIKVKHILIRLPKNAFPKDTLAAFHKISFIRDSIINGASFEEMAVRYSEDASARDNRGSGYIGNKGNLGYFSAFKMVYPFEEAAFRTPVGEVSKPFRTRFGYHIVQVDDLRASKGEVEVAHILITDKSEEGKKLIYEIYQRLENKEHFKPLARKYSNDNATRARGGKLRKFGIGTMVKEFEDVAFSLENEEDYSEPFQTKFGWHIVKLIKKHPVKDFKELEFDLRRQVATSARAQLSQKVVIERLKQKYSIREANDINQFLNEFDVKNSEISGDEEYLFLINDAPISKESFVNYVKRRPPMPLYDLYNAFKDESILNYYKENLERSEPNFANTIEEYRDGLLLFELMQREIWSKAAKDSIGLNTYYQKHSNRFNNKPLKEVKGQVMSDYQNFLEKSWLAELRKKSEILVNKEALEYLKKYYNYQ